jgi:hypothetical protein
MKNYDILLHQPHPPGYFLYVMLGRACNLIFADANYALILQSIIFSGLTVLTIYYLGREIFDEKTGLFAALLALTSPNFWFHGEVALTYANEAFFSAFIGLLCWRASKGDKGYLWFSVALLAIAGGFRQNTPFFFFPLWLYSTRKESIGKILSCLLVFTIISLSWFLPMVFLTGGEERFFEAFKELMRFNSGHVSIIEKGIPALTAYARALHSFITITLGVALPLTLLALYALVRNRSVSLLKNTKSSFFAFWIIPSLMFYLLFFIHQDNPGYILVLLPPLVLVAANAMSYLCSELSKLTNKSIHRILFSITILVNAAIFLFPHIALSRYGIIDHDRDIVTIRNSLRKYNPESTYLFVGPYIFYSYRHLMLYLPKFSVFQVDTRTSPTGQRRMLFGGLEANTFMTETLKISKGITTFAAITVTDNKNLPNLSSKFSTKKISDDFVIVSGRIENICLLYHELIPYWSKENIDSVDLLTATEN